MGATVRSAGPGPEAVAGVGAGGGWSDWREGFDLPEEAVSCGAGPWGPVGSEAFPSSGGVARNGGLWVLGYLGPRPTPGGWQLLGHSHACSGLGVWRGPAPRSVGGREGSFAGRAGPCPPSLLGLWDLLVFPAGVR